MLRLDYLTSSWEEVVPRIAPCQGFPTPAKLSLWSRRRPNWNSDSGNNSSNNRRQGKFDLRFEYEDGK
jgi:hypothetical protein